MTKAIYSLILVSLLAFSSVASAEERGVRSRPQLSQEYKATLLELKDRVNARAASSAASSTVRAQVEARKASTTARRIEVQQNVAKRQAERAQKVFSATVEHLESVLARVESRIAKVKAAGGDTSASDTSVAEVKTHLSLAKTELAAFSAIQITSDKASENFEAVRVAGAKVKEHIREAHRFLVQAIRALKPGRLNATSTNVTSTDEDDD